MWIGGLALILIILTATAWWAVKGWRASNGQWWTRLSAVGTKTAGAAVTVLIGTGMLAQGPALIHRSGSVLTAVLAVTALGAWSTCAWVDPRRKGAPHWLTLAWVIGGFVGAWFVGFPSSYYNNVQTYNAQADLVVQTLRPLIHGAWFAVLLWVVGFAHVGWLRKARERNVAAREHAAFENEMRQG